MLKRVATEEMRQIVERFFYALDAVIAKKELDGAQTFCNAYGIDKRNLYKQKKDMDRRIFQASWLIPLVKHHHVNAEWLLTGNGDTFTK